jgi:tetratricopeptide (TPR) repeat protein
MRWRSIEILPKAHSIIGLGKIFVGRAEETEAHIAEAVRLSPRDTLAYIWLFIAGVAKNYLSSWEQAVRWFRRAIEANRNFPLAFFHLSAALAQLGRLDEARSAVKAGLALDPNFSVSRAAASRTARSGDPTYLAQLAAILAVDVVGYYSRLMGANETRRANAVCERADVTPMSPSTTAASRQQAARIRLRKQRQVNAAAIVLFSHSWQLGQRMKRLCSGTARLLAGRRLSP